MSSPITCRIPKNTPYIPENGRFQEYIRNTNSDHNGKKICWKINKLSVVLTNRILASFDLSIRLRDSKKCVSQLLCENYDHITFESAKLADKLLGYWTACTCNRKIKLVDIYIHCLFEYINVVKVNKIGQVPVRSSVR